MNEYDIISEVVEKYGEHLEMLPDDEYEQYLIYLLARLLAKEKDEKQFYKSLTYGK